MQTLLHSDENYYNSKRANNHSFHNFLRILIVVFLGAFIAKTPWNALSVPILAYIGTASLIITIILNILLFLGTQNALDEYRSAIHKTFDEQDTSYINETPRGYKNLHKISILLISFFILSIVICPTSYIVESTLGPKEVKQMPKKQQSTQHPSRKVSVEKNEKLWDTPSPPITPTPAKPEQPPTKTPETVQPAQPTQPESKPQSSTKKE